MALFDFLKKKKAPENKLAQNDHGNPDVWESADAIFIGNQHISGPGMHISCDVKYSPSNRAAICRTTSTNDATPRYETLAVPAEINTADALIAFIMSKKPWLVHGYKLNDELRQRIDATFIGKAQQAAEISRDSLEQIKRAAIKYMPSSMSAAQLKPVFEMLSGLIDVDMVMVMLEATSWSAAHRAEDNGDANASAAVRQAFAETGFRINGFMDAFKESYLAERIDSASEETLLKAFIAADFYAKIWN